MLSSHPPTKLFPGFPNLRDLWIGLPFFVALLKGFFPLSLFDFWWHLKMGQVIFETSAIPRFDLFSFTATGRLYVLQNWLAEILFYLIYTAGGFPLLVFTNGVLLAAVLVPTYALSRKLSDSLGAAIFATVIAAICLPVNMRPQVFSYLMFALFYWLLVSYCHGSRKRIWLLPALMALWANLHGAFVLGLLLISVVLVCEIVRSLIPEGREAPGKAQLCQLALILALCMTATIVNPEGYNIYKYVLTIANEPALQHFALEWQPPAIGSAQGAVLFFIPFFILTLILIASELRPMLTDFTIYVVFAILGMMATRNSTWFLLIAAPLMARYMPHVPFLRRFLEPRHHLDPSVNLKLPGHPKASLLNFCIVIAAFAIFVFRSPWLRPQGLLDSRTPVAAMSFIDKNRLNGNIFHPQEYGDYLIWRLWPKQRSFYDGRIHLFGEDFVASYHRILNDPDWAEALEKYSIRYLLLPKSEKESDQMKMIGDARRSTGWNVLYEDSVSILFEKSP